MPTQIGAIPVPCSEWWPGRVKFISLQKPGTLSVRYWIPVLRVAVAFQQCTGSWPALCTLWIAPKGRERRDWVVYHWFLLCVVATLCSHCAMRIAEVLHFFFFQIIPGEVFLTCCPFTWRRFDLRGATLWSTLDVQQKIKLHHLLKKCLNLLKTNSFCN